MFGFGCCSANVSHVAEPGSAQGSRKAPAAPLLRGNLVRSYFMDIETDFYLGQDQELGKGGCGVVVVGEHKETHTQYAIKIIDKSHAERGRLDRELKLLKDVDHANIVRLFSVYDTPAHLYFVMELCLGGHLGNLLARQPNKYLDEDWAKKLCRQILSAVAYIHGRGIAHRDIKLQNILIDSHNDHTAQVKLIDFGYGSRFVGALPMRTKCGTPYTTAPEVIRESYDERCDVWSVGVVLYIMLCGRRPFEAVDIAGPLSDAGKAAMITNILAGRYHFNHKPWQHVSKAGINFVKTLLHHDYRTRVRSSEAMENPWLHDAKIIDSQQHALVSAKSFNAVSKLMQVPGSSEMQRTGMVALVFGIQAYVATDLRAVFQSFDADGSGALSKTEFQRALAKLAPELSTADVNQLFDLIDIDKNKQISFTEFLVATLDPREVDLEELNKAFKLLDEDGNGYITRDELRKVIRTQLQQALDNSAATEAGRDAMKRNVPTARELQIAEEVEKKVNDIFDEVDVNKDGVISHAEFFWAMTGLESHLFYNQEVKEPKTRKISRSYQSSPNLIKDRDKEKEKEKEKRPSRDQLRPQRSMGVITQPQGEPNLRLLRNAVRPTGAKEGPPVPSSSTAAQQQLIAKQEEECADGVADALGAGPSAFVAQKRSPRRMPQAYSARFGPFAASHDEEVPVIEEGGEEEERMSRSSRYSSARMSHAEDMNNNGTLQRRGTRSSLLDSPSDDEFALGQRFSTNGSDDDPAVGSPGSARGSIERASPATVAPPNYKGILAHNNKKQHMAETFTTTEVSPRGPVTSRTLAFYDTPEMVGGIHPVASKDSADCSSSSYDAEMVASLFGPPPTKKYFPGDSRKTQPEVDAEHERSSTVRSVKIADSSNKTTADTTAPNNASNSNKTQQDKPDLPVFLSTVGKARSSTIIDASLGTTIKMSTDHPPSDKSKSVSLHKPKGPSRAPSFKRDISERFLDIHKDLDHTEERIDAEPVPPMLCRNPSARGFSMSSMLKREHDSSSHNDHADSSSAHDKTSSVHYNNARGGGLMRMLSGRMG